MGKKCPTVSLRRELECKECQLDEDSGDNVGTSKHFTGDYLFFVTTFVQSRRLSSVIIVQFLTFEAFVVGIGAF